MYLQPGVDEPLSHGDIIDECPVFSLEAKGSPIDLDAAPASWRFRAVVLTQTCDLANAKTSKILVALMYPAELLVNRGILKPQAIRDQVRRGLVYGWYFLPTAPAPIALTESIIDLHDLHTLSRPVLQQLIAEGKRVCRLASPYREHLAQHFAVTYMRIGLPEPIESEP